MLNDLMALLQEQQNQPDMARSILSARFQPTAQDVGNSALASVGSGQYVNPQSYADERMGNTMKQMALIEQITRQNQTADIAAMKMDLDERRLSESERHNRAIEAKGTVGNTKPLPVTAVKLQNEALQDLQIAESIKADIGNVRNTLKSGGLKLGPVTNIMSQAKNFAGQSDPNSRNFATFKATLQKLRNDSLRLNKGTQTEGDAIRAWDEILTNINDPAVVEQRLGEIQAINDRAADFKRLNIDTIRSNFGHDPFDFSPYQSASRPAIMNPTSPVTLPGAADEITADDEAEYKRMRGIK